MSKQTAQTALNQIARRQLSKTRRAEFKKAEARAANAIDKFWAGSALASVLRDYQAGRITTINVG